MSWSGSSFSRTNGVYTGSTVWQQDNAAGVNILDTRHDTHDQDLSDGINACLNKNGANSPTADIAFGGFKATNVGSATARTHWAAASQVQDGGFVWGGTSGGSANVQTITLSPAITAYATGQAFKFLAGFTNTGSTTLNVNSVGAKTIKTYDGAVNLTAGDIVSGAIYEVVYDGTNFVLLNPSRSSTTWSPSYTGSGTLTYTTVTESVKRYDRDGAWVNFILVASGTVAGAGDTIFVSPPVTSADSNVAVSVAGYEAAFVTCTGFFNDTTHIAIQKLGGNWTAGSVRIHISGLYRV